MHDSWHLGALVLVTTSGLVVWMDTVGNGYAGGVAYTLKFTNLSGHACALYGYPEVSAVTLSGHPLGTPALGGTIRPTTVYPGQPRHGDGDTADHRPGQLRYRLLPARADSGARQAGQAPHRGRAACLPAEPPWVRLQGDPVPLQCLLPHRARLAARNTGEEITGDN